MSISELQDVVRAELAREDAAVEAAWRELPRRLRVDRGARWEQERRMGRAIKAVRNAS